MTAEQITAKENELIEQGWHWAADPTSWSGGFFWHEDHGYCTNQGGYWSWIGDAIASVVRVETMMEQIS